MTRTKICGVTTAADRDAAVAAGADGIGFVTNVSVETPRELEPDAAATLVEGVPPLVTSVLVTMPRAVQAAVRLFDRVAADAIQVHGGLGPDGVAALRRRVPARVIAAVDVDEPAIRAYAEAADALLVDSTDDAGGGGTGRTHDWTRTRELAADLDVPVVLAGGLTPENVTEAIRQVRPFAVDTATGVERSGGRKDHDAVKAFVDRATRAEVSA